MEVGTDSFISLADADSYWSGDSDWTDASEADKEKALKDATVFIDNGYDWPGSIESADQTLSWPRTKAYDTEGRKLTGIPKAIEDATAYLAGQQIKGTPIFEVRGQKIISMSAGPVEIEYDEDGEASTTYEYLKSILSKITYTGSSQIKLVRS